MKNLITLTVMLLAAFSFSFGQSNTDESGYQSSTWNDAGAWFGSVVPDSTYNITVSGDANPGDGDVVTVSVRASVHDLLIAENATLNINSGQTLAIYGDLVLQSGATLVSANGGRVVFRNDTNAQTVTNNSSNTIEFSRLYTDNPNGITLSTGAASVARDFELNSGVVDIDGSFTFLSANNLVSHISDVGIGANLTGNITVQRWVDSRDGGWNNIAASVVGTTVSDLDDEIAISGVTGADGFAFNSNGGAFISMWKVNASTQSYEAVGNVTDPMTNGVGYEIWLEDDNGSWTGKAWELSGTVNLNNQKTIVIESGWNLVGNPYPAFLNFGTITNNNFNITNNSYWTVGSTTNTFTERTSLQVIPPGQGFWVHTTDGTDISLNPQNGFFGSTSDQFYKKEYTPNDEFRILITNQNSDRPQASNVFLRKNSLAYAGHDAIDLPIIRRPDPNTCLVAFDNNGSKNMVNYVSTDANHLELPLSVESGMEADFEMTFAGLDQFSEYQCISLHNKSTGEMTSIGADETYEFHLDKNRPSEMTLIMSKDDYADCLIENIQTDSEIKINSINKTIIADFALEQAALADIKIYDVMGNVIFTGQKNVGYNREVFPLDHISSGVYLINVTINGESQTEKVVLR
jgi:hypothetical protein